MDNIATAIYFRSTERYDDVEIGLGDTFLKLQYGASGGGHRLYSTTCNQKVVLTDPLSDGNRTFTYSLKRGPTPYEMHTVDARAPAQYVKQVFTDEVPFTLNVLGVIHAVMHTDIDIHIEDATIEFHFSKPLVIEDNV